MSLKEVRMGLTPPSSRSFKRVTEALFERQDAILGRLDEIVHRSICLEAKVDSLASQLAVMGEHNRLRFEGLYRQDGESAEQAKRRFFASIPPATGEKRKMQLANAKLMERFDFFCKKLNLTYWFSYGTLVATLSRSGFIPWDDDIDLCMMREDAEALFNYLKTDDSFQISLVYDWFSPCRQLRFSSRDPLIPCFVDVSLYDWVRDASKEADDYLRSIRLEIMNEVHSSIDRMEYWRERGWLLAPGSGEVVQSSPVDFSEQNENKTLLESDQIEQFFTSYQDKAREAGIICSRDNAGAVAYALDNTYDAPWRRIVWPLEMIFPVASKPFESYEFSVPHDAEGVANECYPGWPYLPSDILSHNHFEEKLLRDPSVSDALVSFIDDGV